jgi:hypothetical protein
MTGLARVTMIAASAAGLLASMLSPAAARQTSYAYSQVFPSTPNGACGNVEINSITNTGVLLGTEFCTANRSSRAFIDRNGRDKVFGVPGNPSLDTEAAGISNNAKYVVLETQHNFAGRYRSYLRTGGKLHKLSDPKAGKKGTLVEGVNNHREIVGQYFTGKSSKHFHAFIERHGKFHTLHLKVKSTNQALIDVNDHGELAGFFQDRHGRYHGFLVRGHKTTVINAPGAGHGKHLGTLLLSISDNGTYCGNVLKKHGAVTKATSHGFIHRSTGYQSIRIPKAYGGHNTNAGTCNDSGEVAGSYVFNEGGTAWQAQGYTATPAP